MAQGDIERRRERRATIRVPIQIRREGVSASEPREETLTANVSLGGAYFETERGEHYALHEGVVVSIAIPEASGRDFPFTRLAGRSRVVRVEELPARAPRTGGPAQAGAGGRRHGVALEFGEQITALSAIRG